MKTPEHTPKLLFLLLGMLLSVLPNLARADGGTLGTETKDAAVASTPRIYVVGDCVIAKKDTGEIIKQCLIPLSSGTGILIGKSERDACVLTSAHIVAEENQLHGELEMDDGTQAVIVCRRPYHLAFFPNGDEAPRIYVAREVVCGGWQDDERTGIDAALLRIPADGLPPAHIIDTSPLETSQPVVAIGYPGFMARPASLLDFTSATNPTLEALERKLHNSTSDGGYITIALNISDRDCTTPSLTTGTIFRHDPPPGLILSAAIGPGSSGGPLIDPRTGYVVGMNTWGRDAHAASSIALSAADLTDFLDRNNIPYRTPSPCSCRGFLIAGGIILVIVVVLQKKLHFVLSALP